MSTTIDQKVVEMRFDNKHFEKNVSTTMSTLDKLKQSLNLTGAAKGLEGVNEAAKRCDMSMLSNGVETVRLKFSALQIMGVTALTNITNSAVNAGKRIASALTIDPIKTGLSEYETQINAVQTIMANTQSKGTTLDDVNNALDELNTYADKTIYNFTEMTRNIGTFTAAGVDLDTSVKSIQGIANLAAVSGSTSQQASTAMYQLSQALAAGKVTLMDWNSVVNAGMGGQVFQDALKRTAKAMGTNVDAIIKKYGSFRESLTQGNWLTTEVLTKTLEQFTMAAKEGSAEWDAYKKSLMDGGYTAEQAEEILKMANTATDAATKVKTFTQLWDTLKETAQSGWTQTWETILGDFEEAKGLFTDLYKRLSPLIEASSQARNELLKGWADNGGRDDLIASFNNLFDAIGSVVKPIKEAFRDIFPPTTVEQLVGFTRGLKEFTAGLKLSDTTSDNLKRTFKGLFAVLDIVKQAISAIFGVLKPLVGSVDDLGGGILGVTAKLGDWLVRLNESIKKGNVFNKALQGLSKVLGALVGVVKGIGKWIKTYMIDPMLKAADVSTEMKDSAVSAFDSMGSAIENCGIFKVLTSVWDGIVKIAKGIAKAFGSITSGVFEKIGSGDFSGVLDFINALISGGIGVAIYKLISTITNSLEGIGDLKDGLIDIVDGLGGCLEGFQSKLKADALMKIAGAIAILAAALLVLAMIDSDRLMGAIGAISVLFTELMLSMNILTKSLGGFKSVAKFRTLASSMISISVAVLVLAVALKQLGELDISQLGVGLLGIAGLMTIVTAAALVLGKYGNKISKGATQMVILAAAIKILASAVEDISYLSWDELGRGLVGVGVLMAELAAFMVAAKFSKKAITTATGTVILAAAIKILASACKDFAFMSWEEIKKGLTAVGLLLAEIFAFTKLTGNAKHVISTGVALIAMAAAIKILASAVGDFGSMSIGDLGKGLLGLAGALAAIVIALKLMPKNILATGVGLIAVSTAILILTNAIKSMGSMSWEEIGKGMTVLAGSLLVLTLALNAMKSTLAGSAALLVAAGALLVLTPVLKVLGSMSWESIGKGLLALAGTFLILGVAGYALSGVAPVIIALAGAIALLGVGVLAAGIGLVALGAGLSAVAVGLTALVSSLGVVCTGIIAIVSAIITGILKGIGDGIVAFCEVIIQGIPAIGEALKVVVLTLCDVLVECVPVIVDTILKIVVALLDSLASYSPKIIDALFNFLIGIIDGLAKNMPRLAQAFANLLMSIFSGAIEALKSIDTDVLIKGILSIGLMAGVMTALAAVASLTPAAMVGVLGMGAVIAELSIVLAAIGALAQIPGLQWLVSEGGDFLETVGTAIGQFIGGVAGGIAQGFTGSLPQVAMDLSKFMTNLKPFIEGAKSFDSSTLDGVKSLVGVVLALTGANIIEGLTSWLTGGSSLTKFGEELAAFGPNMRAYADAVTGIDTTAVEASANASKALAEMCNHIPNSGGMAAWFAGDNSAAQFGSELVELGQGLKGFSDAIIGVNPAAIVAAANAAKVLVDMTNYIPNEGGMAAWFAGDNSVSKFGKQLVTLGQGLKDFSDAIVGVNPESLTAAANAAKALCDMTSSIPNEGGMVSWFAGDNSVSKFAGELVTLGIGLKGFSDVIAGVNPENLTAAANAAKALAEMCNYIPNSGGIVTWFTGDNSIARFSVELVLLGRGLKGFSDAITGVNAEAMMAAANAAKALAEMTTYIPNEGGMVSWFTGEASISKFGSELTVLGQGLKGFSNAVAGVNAESMIAAANAAKSLAEMTTYIPNEGGMAAWFAGEASIANFADKLPALGQGLKGFSDSIEGINPENVSAAANAAKALAEMTATIPTEGGIKAWFTGETSIANFADKLPTLGDGLKGFSDSVAGINPENVTAAASAAKSLGEMADTVPDSTKHVVKFGENLVDFGKKLKTYFSGMTAIGDGSISTFSKALDAVKEISNINAGNIKSVATAIKELTTAVKNMAKDIKSDLKDAGKEAIESFIKGINDKIPSAEKACKTMITDAADAASKKASSFGTAGKDCVIGFANGISENTYRAEAQAKAMAKAAAKAAKKALDINSPSKVFRAIGTSVPEGFALGVEKYKDVISSAKSMSEVAITSVKESISRIATMINDDIGGDPVIRPVLDLSEVEYGASSIRSIFGNGASIGVSANVGAIGAMMSRNNQNGGFGEMVSAIDKLRKDINNMERNTYTIGDITYDDGSNIAGAVKSLVRAARVERRT